MDDEYPLSADDLHLRADGVWARAPNVTYTTGVEYGAAGVSGTGGVSGISNVAHIADFQPINRIFSIGDGAGNERMRILPNGEISFNINDKTYLYLK